MFIHSYHLLLLQTKLLSEPLQIRSSPWIYPICFLLGLFAHLLVGLYIHVLYSSETNMFWRGEKRTLKTDELIVPGKIRRTSLNDEPNGDLPLITSKPGKYRWCRNSHLTLQRKHERTKIWERVMFQKYWWSLCTLKHEVVLCLSLIDDKSYILLSFTFHINVIWWKDWARKFKKQILFEAKGSLFVHAGKMLVQWYKSDWYITENPQNKVKRLPGPRGDSVGGSALGRVYLFRPAAAVDRSKQNLGPPFLQ